MPLLCIKINYHLHGVKQIVPWIHKPNSTFENKPCCAIIQKEKIKGNM